jgi:hypothetical protein
MRVHVLCSTGKQTFLSISNHDSDSTNHKQKLLPQQCKLIQTMPEQCSLVQALLLSQVVSQLVESHAHYTDIAGGCLQWSLCVCACSACMQHVHACIRVYIATCVLTYVHSAITTQQ